MVVGQDPWSIPDHEMRSYSECYIPGSMDPGYQHVGVWIPPEYGLRPLMVDVVRACRPQAMRSVRTHRASADPALGIRVWW